MSSNCSLVCKVPISVLDIWPGNDDLRIVIRKKGVRAEKRNDDFKNVFDTFIDYYINIIN